MSDLAKLAVEETATLPLKDADDELLLDDQGRPYEFEIHGPGSKLAVTVTDEIGNQNLGRMMKGRGKQVTTEQLREQNIHKMARLTKRVSDNVEYSKSTAERGSVPWLKALFADHEIGFIFDQVLAFHGDWANFRKRSATS